MQLPSGRGKVNAWGENHLWLRYRKGSKLSGLVEPRILVAKASESVNLSPISNVQSGLILNILTTFDLLSLPVILLNG
ncbi:MAG: hypothetical protein HCA26_08210 [Dolichospermum sp. DET66]|nr:hypothetical protein [Dolichospermum sp. DET66]